MYLVKKNIITKELVSSFRVFSDVSYEKCEEFIKKENRRLKKHKGCEFEFKITIE